MSVSSIIDLAVARGRGTPERTERYAASGESPAAALPLAGGTGVLTSVIPTESREALIDAYLGRHGFGVAAEASTLFSTVRDVTDPHTEVRDVMSDPRKSSSEVLPGTERDGPTPGRSNS